MTTALDLDLQRLKARAFDRAEWAGGFPALPFCHPECYLVDQKHEFERVWRGNAGFGELGVARPPAARQRVPGAADSEVRNPKTTCYFM